MTVARSTVSSLRESLATYRAGRARRANMDAIASSDLSPNARHEVMVILAHNDAVESMVPAARQAGVDRRVGAGMSTSV